MRRLTRDDEGAPRAMLGARSRGAISLAVIFANELLTAGATVADRVFTLNRERLGILRGPHGEILDVDSVPPIDRERLTQIRVEMPLLSRRVRRIRSAVLIIWIAIGLLMLSVAAIPVAVTARSEAAALGFHCALDKVEVTLNRWHERRLSFSAPMKMSRGLVTEFCCTRSD